MRLARSSCSQLLACDSISKPTGRTPGAGWSCGATELLGSTTLDADPSTGEAHDRLCQRTPCASDPARCRPLGFEIRHNPAQR